MKSIRTQDEGVSKVRKKITALTVVFSLIIAMFAGGLQTFAAGADDISITGLVSDSATAQKFRIDNQTNRQIEVQWQTEEYNTGWTPVTIAANGSAVVNCADPDMTGVKLMVYCDGEIKSLASLNTYSVNVVYQDQSGNRLGGATEYNTISGGVSHTAPSSLQLSGETYLISGPEYKEFSYQSNTTEIVYTYQHQQKQPITCPVLYVDQYGNQIGSASFQVQPNSAGSFTAPQSYTSNGRSYTLMAGQSASVSHDYNKGVQEYVFRYQLVTEESTRPYLFRVQYQTISGALLKSSSVTVQSGSTATFQVANEYMTADGTLYTKAAGEPSVISHNYNDSTRLYTVKYEESKATKPYDISVRYVDALTGLTLKTDSVHVGLNETAGFTADSEITVNGVEYVAAAGQSRQIVHAFEDSKRIYEIYYSEKGAEAQSYPVTIRYFDVTEGRVLYTTTVTASYDSQLTVTAPENYTAGGENYVMLGGQSASIAHEFYSTRHAYVFFYRNVNDTANEDTIVEVTPEDNTVVVTPDGETIVATPGGEVTIDDEPVPLAPGTDDDASSQSSSSSNSSEASEVTIDDEEVPLAPGPDNQGGSSSSIGWWIAGGGVLLLAVGAAVLLIVMKKKKAKKDAQ